MQRHWLLRSSREFQLVSIWKVSAAQSKFLTSETCIDHNDSSSWDLFKDVVQDCNKRRGSNSEKIMRLAPTGRWVKTKCLIPPFVKKQHLFNQPDRRSSYSCLTHIWYRFVLLEWEDTYLPWLTAPIYTVHMNMNMKNPSRSAAGTEY